MEINLGYSDEDWRNDILKSIQYAAKEDKPIVYAFDEFRITNDDWYYDLEQVLKSSVCSEITTKKEILEILVSIQAQRQKGFWSSKPDKTS